MFWKIVYIVYPPFLRFLEAMKVHKGKQDYLLGTINKKYNFSDLEKMLSGKGYTKSILAWKDTGEILNMRLLDKEKFQYHIRLFSDGQIRAHHEFSPEANPWAHIKAKRFERENSYFENLLVDYLVK